jgi:hypothetical protein
LCWPSSKCLENQFIKKKFPSIYQISNW